MDGVDLLAGPQTADRELYAETDYPRVAGWAPQRSLVSGSWKLLRSSPLELYDIERDPGETKNLAGERAAIASAMAIRIGDLDAAGKSAASTPSPEAQERLRALGYVAASPSASIPADAPNAAREIAAWGEFEDALADVSAGRRDRALPRLAALAARYPNAQVFRKTHAQALLDSGRASEALKAYRAHGRDVAERRVAAARPGRGRARRGRCGRGAARRTGRARPRPEVPAGPRRPRPAPCRRGARRRRGAPRLRRRRELEPSNPSYWTNLGNAARELGDTARATTAYQRALSIDADVARRGERARRDARAGGPRRAEAVPWFEKALARSPDFVEAQLNLGIALQQAGQIERAKTQYRKVLGAPRKYRRQREAAATLLGSLR